MIWPLEDVPERLEAWAAREAESVLKDEERRSANTLALHGQDLQSELAQEAAKLDADRKEAALFVTYALGAARKEVMKTGVLINQVMPAMRDYARDRSKMVLEGLLRAQ